MNTPPGVPPVRPFLKWAGNKYRLLPRIHAMLPTGSRLIEPFAGSGAVFLNTRFEHYLLTDTNADLINLYTILQEEGPTFIRSCRRYFSGEHNNAESYYHFRDRFNHSTNLRNKAALFVYLNRHGYNGLCRYNASGGYNVPFGRYKRPYFPEREMLAFHAKAHRARFELGSFEQTIRQAGPGDVIYCDPPYVPLSRSASFTAYSAGGFDLGRQEQLAQLAEEAAVRGIPVLVSNHNTAFTRNAYRNASLLRKFHVQRYISCNGQQRNHAGEVLALFD
ncbi:MAG: Dam family site-specific DNA-(adenine-N6)-methyltransferase [Proteobacteria bacterium]|nr:Dam family site-specific DNA-(adenine-N6)-methyltransferase [Pseudomonadota bacterium]MCG6935103.1 Dam family site-specific DNA-(adenine-N6)-methyltransferase [Pseudomonadota bacterium]